MRYLAVTCMMAACLLAAPATGQDPLANVIGQRAVVPVGKPLVVGDMTLEETVVRTAYAKFAYASEQDAMDQLAMEVNNVALQHRKEYAGLDWPSAIDGRTSHLHTDRLRGGEHTRYPQSQSDRFHFSRPGRDAHCNDASLWLRRRGQSISLHLLSGQAGSPPGPRPPKP